MKLFLKIYMISMRLWMLLSLQIKMKEQDMLLVCLDLPAMTSWTLEIIRLRVVPTVVSILTMLIIRDLKSVSKNTIITQFIKNIAT